MEPDWTKLLAAAALVVIVLRLALLVQRRSVARQPIHGGWFSLACNFLSGLCFVAILPTVCISVLFLHPAALELAGLTWHPLLVIVVALGAGSLLFALLHGLVERGPLQRAFSEIAARDARGWTEEDARTAGL